VADGWPVELRGVTESVVTTAGPNGRFNVAALGIHAPAAETDSENGTAATARTWGQTRTWRNFRERGEGYVQFVHDPLVFVDATLDIREIDDPVLDGAHAWVRARVERVDTGTRGGTEWTDWRLHPEQQGVEERVVPAFNRGYAAVVEATVAASRLDVPTYDTDRLLERIDYFEDIARRCGGAVERDAFERIRATVDETLDDSTGADGE